jgi:site-specific recombinase XerD
MQVNVDEVILRIQTAMYKLLDQAQLNELKNVLYMSLCKYQLIEEETALSTTLDDNWDKVNMFLATLKIEGKTDNTIKAYITEYKVFFSQVNKNFRDITTNDIRMYLAYCKTIRKNSDVTLNNRIHNLMSLFKWLNTEEYIIKNPMLKIKIAKTEKRVKEVLTDEQTEIIRCSCKEERDLAILDMLAATGMRVGELVKLNRSEIDFMNGQCVVYGKGRKERPVYLNGKAKVHLLNYLDGRKDNNPALFVGLKTPHERLTESGVRAMMNKLTGDNKAKNIHLHPHKLRRTMATNMINRGAPVEYVQKILGHASVQTTLQCYASISNQIVKDAHRKYAS